MNHGGHNPKREGWERIKVVLKKNKTRKKKEKENGQPQQVEYKVVLELNVQHVISCEW